MFQATPKDKAYHKLLWLESIKSFLRQQVKWNERATKNFPIRPSRGKHINKRRQTELRCLSTTYLNLNFLLCHKGKDEQYGKHKENKYNIITTSPFNKVHESYGCACSIDIQSKIVTKLQSQIIYNSKSMRYSAQQSTKKKL